MKGVINGFQALRPGTFSTRVFINAFELLRCQETAFRLKTLQGEVHVEVSTFLANQRDLALH